MTSKLYQLLRCSSREYQLINNSRSRFLDATPAIIQTLSTLTLVTMATKRQNGSNPNATAKTTATDVNTTARRRTRLLVINPNATESMTNDIADAARRAAGDDVEIVAKTNTEGPPSVQGEADGIAAVPGVLNLITAAQDVDAAIIACFDDTGLAEARASAPFPVVGIGEASYIVAGLVSERFSVVTTLAVSIPVLEGNIERGGWGKKCARVRASGIPVLALESDPGAVDRLVEEISFAEEQDGVGAVVLGCAGMGRHVEALTERTGKSVYLVEPVAAATRLALVAASSCTK